MTEPVWTFPGPLLDMLAKGLREGGYALYGIQYRHPWLLDRGQNPGVVAVNLKTDSGWVTIRRLEGT